MRTNLALRYLLLCHVKSFQHRIGEDKFVEVAATLQVRETFDEYVIEWTREGESKQTSVPKHMFVFYERSAPASIHPITSDRRQSNAVHADMVVKEVLGIDDVRTIQPLPIRAWIVPSLYEILEAALFVLALFVFGQIGLLNGVIFSGLIFVEFFRHGRLYASVMFILLALRSPANAVMGAGVYAVLQYIDPNPFARRTRVVLNLTALSIALVVLSHEWETSYDCGTVTGWLLFAATGIAGLRSCIGRHERALPLVLPFLVVGFAFRQNLSLAGIGLLYCAFSASLAYVISGVAHCGTGDLSG